MVVRLLKGDMRVTLAGLEPGSVQACVTSPPFFGLRSYGTPDLVWGGDPDHAHEWTNQRWYAAQGNGTSSAATFSEAGPDNAARLKTARWHDNNQCACGAWLGSLGLEPTVDAFISHLVECFREVKRVLADSGVLWVNMGDSYSGSGNGSNDHRENGSSLSKNDQKYVGQKPGPTTLPAKNLLMVHSRLAIALQQDGWILRSMIPWVKASSMPESVGDRPSSAVEYIFMFSKSPRYFFDADAVRVDGADPFRQRSHERIGGANGHTVRHSVGGVIDGTQPSRNRRNSDWMMDSLRGLLLNEDDEPLAFMVNPAAYKGAHFATWPMRLVEPMVKASTSEKGQCPTCGAPWVRQTERGELIGEAVIQAGPRPAADERGVSASSLLRTNGRTMRETTTTGWRPSCGHSAALVPVPQVCLDPFAGAGTTLLVADRLGRNAIGCELSESYAELGTDRLIGDSPMFMDLESA